MSTIVSEPSPLARSEKRAARSERLRLLARSPLVIGGAIVIAFWIFCALFPGLVTPYNPIFDNNFVPSQPPSWAHPFGTDTNGRDIFSRVLAGSRAILQISIAATVIATVLGTSLGLVTGYLRGVVDDVMSRFVDAILSLPLIITAIFIVTAVGNSGRSVVTLIIGLIFTPVISRTVRAGVLGEAELDYVQAARLRGERAPYMMFSEILPNVMSPCSSRSRSGSAMRSSPSRRSASSGSGCPSLAGLGRADLPVLHPDRSVVVDDPLPGTRDREPRRRGQPRLGRRQQVLER